MATDMRTDAEFAEGRILCRVEGPIGWIVFNQPERHNAVRLDMWQALPEAVALLEGNPSVRVLVCAGAGDRAFVSGADIAEFDHVRHNAASNRAFTTAVSAATLALAGSRLPVIAMIQGFCIGGGVVIASACDIRICSEGSRFGVPPGRLGLGYEYDNFNRLVDLIGPGMAMEMILTARQLSHSEAFAAGFVNRVVSVAALRETVIELASSTARNAPMSLSAAKICLQARRGEHTPAAAQAAIDACFDSEDFREGRLAFHEKREPQFQGR
jgi:enoyl-CoA hydratase/carnithine racemase